MPALCKALISLKTGDGWTVPGSEILLDTDEALRLQASKAVAIIERDDEPATPAADQAAAKPTRKKGGSAAS